MGCYWADLGVSDAKRAPGRNLSSPLGYWRENTRHVIVAVVAANGEFLFSWWGGL